MSPSKDKGGRFEMFIRRLKLYFFFLVCSVILLQVTNEATADSTDTNYTLSFRIPNISASDMASYGPVVEFTANLNGNSLGTFTLGYVLCHTEKLDYWYWYPETQKFDVTASLYSSDSIYPNILQAHFLGPKNIPLKNSWISYWRQQESEAEAETHENKTVGYVYAQFYRNGVEMGDARGFVLDMDGLDQSPIKIKDLSVSFKIN
jgi:hypothetical protein